MTAHDDEDAPNGDAEWSPFAVSRKIIRLDLSTKQLKDRDQEIMIKLTDIEKKVETLTASVNALRLEVVWLPTIKSGMVWFIGLAVGTLLLMVFRGTFRELMP